MPQHRDTIVVGASAGGVEALTTLVGSLPADLPAAVAVVLHLPAGGTSALARILDRAGPLSATTVRRSVVLEPGIVYVAPPDHHLLMIDGELALSHGPTENGYRPAINALFRSAAVAAGPRAIGVVLSGSLDDGAAGLASILGRGGAAVVQDPREALYRGMPDHALRHAPTAAVCSVTAMAGVLSELVAQDIGVLRAAPPDPLLVAENHIAGGAVRPRADDRTEGSDMPGFSCPDCYGVLTELEPGNGRYRCRVGHAWTADALLAAQGGSLERALWTALRTLDEKVVLAERMRDQTSHRGSAAIAARYGRVADEARDAAEVLRQHLRSAAVIPATSGDPT